jgi:hypothetical protein
MRKDYLLRKNGIIILFMMLLISGCATSISGYDQQAYMQTTSIKVDALNLMDSAKYEYNNHIQAVQKLQTNLQKIYEYEKNRPKNDITIKLWDKLLDKNGHLLGGFIERWKSGTKMSDTFISNCKDQVGEAFDTISGLESQKIKKTDLSK